MDQNRSTVRHIAGEAYSRTTEAVGIIFASGLVIALGLRSINPIMRRVTEAVAEGRDKNAIATLCRRAHESDLGQWAVGVGAIGLATCGLAALIQALLIAGRRREFDPFYPLWIAVWVCVSLAAMAGLFHFAVRPQL